MIQRIVLTGEVDEDGLPVELATILLSGLPHHLFSDGSVLPFVRGGATDDDESESDDDESDDDSSEDDDDEGEEKPTTLSDSERKRLHRENAKHRVANKKLRQAIEEQQARIDELESSKDSEAVKKERDDLKAKLADATANINMLRIEGAVRDEATALNLDPKRMRAIIKVMDMDDVEVDDDGEVTGVHEALETIAKDYPEWVIKPSGKDDEEGDDKDETSGSSSGKPFNSKKGSKGIDREALAQRFPALQHR